MPKMVSVITCCDSGPLAEESTYYAKVNSNIKYNEIILVDMGSYTPLPKYHADRLIRFEENKGPYAVHHDIIPYLNPYTEVVAFLHTDLMIREQGWDQFILAAFSMYPKLGLVGFLGSDEIDMAGGRGGGTMSSFMGYEYKTIWSSKAEVHGKRALGIHAAAVLDHCGLIFRLSVLKEIPPAAENHVPFHFYDRVVCAEVLSRGYHLAVCGIECDHASGGTGLSKARISPEMPEPGVLNRDELYKTWAAKHNFILKDEPLDQQIYSEGERRYLGKWRDSLHFIPLKVNEDYSITYRHPLHPLVGEYRVW